jgi:fumarate reductase flavoprotein subunit
LLKIGYPPPKAVGFCVSLNRKKFSYKGELIVKNLAKSICRVVFVLTVISACSTSGTRPKLNFNPGTYTAIERGMGGSFDVTVTFSDHAIESIVIGENNETYMVGSEAIRILPERIIQNQSLKLDVVSGASITSHAILYGVRDCVAKAGGNLDALLAVPVVMDTYDTLPHEADIIIVGGGLSGITAAISAKQNGGNVILLEQKEYLGGNTTMAVGTFIFGGTSIQRAAGIQDTPDAYYHWALENSHNQKDPVQVRMIADYGQELIDYYGSMDIKFNNTVFATAGSPINRGHRVTPSTGGAISQLQAYMEKIGIDVRYATKAEDFILNSAGEIIGVKAVDYYKRPVEYYGKSIVLATGGWGDNHEMINKYWGKEYDPIVYGGATGMDGVMLNAALKLGADLVDMNAPHLDATLAVGRGILVWTNFLTDCGGIVIRQNGQRFADEQSIHGDIVATAMHDIGDEYYYEIIDNNSFNFNAILADKLMDYIRMDLMSQYDSVAAMANGLGVDEAVLTQTLNEYNGAVRGEVKDKYNRTGFFHELAPPFYTVKVSNGVVCTTGGLKVNEKMQVINTSGSAIPRLYAIGEISGGYRIHYVGGDSLSHGGISGMLLGKALTASR